MIHASKSREFIRKWANAIVAKDDRARDRVIDDIERWNKANPKLEVHLRKPADGGTPIAVKARVQQMESDVKARAFRGLPKTMRPYISPDATPQ
jgi:phage terminase large subunit-like protein